MFKGSSNCIIIFLILILIIALINNYHKPRIRESFYDHTAPALNYIKTPQIQNFSKSGDNYISVSSTNTFKVGNTISINEQKYIIHGIGNNLLYLNIPLKSDVIPNTPVLNFSYPNQDGVFVGIDPGINGQYATIDSTNNNIYFS
jgi:hypothetical protein